MRERKASWVQLWALCAGVCVLMAVGIAGASPASQPASRPVPRAAAGANPTKALPPPQGIKKKRITLQLLSEYDVVVPGQQLWVGVHQRIIKEWHTYWKNPGDSGTAPKMKWQLPKGVKASPIHWPVPHKIRVAHLVNYGYSDEVMLLFQISVPKDYKGTQLTLRGQFVWLVCKSECIPGKGIISRTLRVGKTPQKANARTLALFKKTLAALPKAPGKMAMTIHVGKGEKEPISLKIGPLTEQIPAGAALSFYPSTGSVLHNAASIKRSRHKGKDGAYVSLAFQKNDYFTGDEPRLRGVLVASWDKGGRHFHQGYRLSGVLNQAAAARAAAAARVVAKPSARRAAPAVARKAASRKVDAKATASNKGGLVDFLAQVKQASLATKEEPELGLWQALLFALLGGLLLNLMPCVFPVLSIKVMHFVEQASQTSSSVRKHGFAFVGGVMASFSLLAGALIVLRASGQLLGWGFQLQSPLFVWALLVLMFGMGLSLSGVFELGGSLMSVGEDLTQQGGYLGSFFTGVLATIVATPCTAPLMAPALGWALTQSATTSLLVFNALGLGMALPYALFSLFPGWLRFLPRPGAWMETLKQVMAFALYGTAIWLLWVLGQQSGLGGMVTALIGLLALAFAGWLFGSTRYKKREKLATIVAGLILIVGLGWSSQRLRDDVKLHSQQLAVQAQLAQAAAGIAAVGQQQAFARGKLDRLLQKRRHVLLNMTAAWCISCKVNEKVALKQDSVTKAMKKHGVYYLVGDWTNQDDEITKVLAMFKRSGVPLYVLFDGKRRTLKILPQLLTPGILTQAMATLK